MADIGYPVLKKYRESATLQSLFIQRTKIASKATTYCIGDTAAFNILGISGSSEQYQENNDDRYLLSHTAKNVTLSAVLRVTSKVPDSIANWS